MRQSSPINPTQAPADAAPADAGAPLSREEVIEIHNKFRALKHSACNALAVIMALSEMAERNPAYVDKLTKTVLAKSPQMVSELRAFDDEFRTLLNAQPD